MISVRNSACQDRNDLDIVLVYWLLFGFIACMVLSHLRPQLIQDESLVLRFFWSLTFVWLVLMIGLRHQIGVDWNVYYDYVERMHEVTFDQVLWQQDPAYELLNWLGVNVGGGVYTVNLIAAIVFCWGLFAFCEKQPRPWLALLVATPYLVIVVAMGYTRQGVAIGLTMLAITYLLNRKVLWFFIFIGLATMFHRSAIIMMPLVLLVGRGQWLILITIAVVGFFILLLQDSLGS